MIEFRLSGSGGQGLILAGIILAEAAIGDGKEALQSQSYGPEARGGSSKSEVIIAERPIYYPKVTSPDILLAMTQEALQKYGNDLQDDKVLIVDSTLVKEVPARFKKVYSVPITQMAVDKLGRELFANIIALGIIAKLSDAVKFSSLERAVLSRVPKGTEKVNSQALQLGYEAV
jgi:2-oxoglutarate ferredoxin oxidoreductase subunit gamma